MTKYVGITIGPIDRIAEYSKSTRSIWASSYIFSFLAKSIITHLKTNCSIENNNFLTPIITDDMFIESPVGRFPDQYVIKVAENANAEYIIKEIYKATDNVLEEIARDIATALNIKTNIDIVKEYLKRVIKVYATIKESTKEDSIVSDFQATFAAMECFDTYQQMEPQNFLAEYFQTKAELLVNDTKLEKFSTILERSAQIKPNEIQDYENGDKDHELKAYQKYIAFVAADGDNFGKTIAKLGEKSKYFTDFSSDLRNAVYKYGGQTIFQGGDDIMFFAPIHNPKSELSNVTDIFSLINHIDKLFEKIVIKKLKEKDEKGDSDWDGLIDKPSLSYGVAIAYYKHPMNETRQRAIELLHKCKYSYNRNAIAWEVRKHSGQTFSGVIDKKEEKPEEKEQSVFAQMLSLISKSIPTPNPTNAGEDIDNNNIDDNFLHSITHWIISHKEIIESVILKNPQKKKKKLLGNYFDNNFNEDSHESKKEFIKAIRNFLLIKDLKEPCANLHAILRYVELLINKSEHGK